MIPTFSAAPKQTHMVMVIDRRNPLLRPRADIGRYRAAAIQAPRRLPRPHLTSKVKQVCQYGVMSGTSQLTPVLAVLALTAAALAGCAAAAPGAVETSEASAPTAGAEPVTGATPAPQSAESETCSSMSEVYGSSGGLYVERRGTLRDLGAREFARGEVTFDGDGTPLTYAVESGDVEAVIAERLCAYPTLGSMNHVRTIQPEQVLWLTPNPDTPWVPYFNPADAPAGFQQIPYQQAIESAGRAVDAGDVDTVQAIWNDTLKGMFVNQNTIDAVQKVVDSGDLDALRQLFS